ncbi:tRNA pseudouridine(13) synthase TruD [Helicobacter enhydrae]|uniref:tRNA pseudouridine synthase D n=1 Tax=Helicobacter enhydrae TaxID=222136 RepID=A0A1B1U449_9HELI|nr:tRNA pseudouridine(13) synthase TruD [Helicobacter enhydrae]ANV97529.1 tRNA pseudouridine(13) synthase TruD [Helicobacter enhydrae]
MHKNFLLTHSEIDFYFSQNPRDFVVNEIPLYPASDDGEHLMLQVRKKGLSTPEMLKILSSVLGCPQREIGYAGLKDKNALTTQYITIPARFQNILEGNLEVLQENQIKILHTAQHRNKMRIGHLKGNAFFIRLKKVSPLNAQKIDQALGEIALWGMPNYFGYQRFGKFGDNYLEGKKLVSKKKKYNKIEQFLVSSYQSYLFNQWLSNRILLSRLCNDFDAKEIKKASQTLNFPLSLDFQSLIEQKQPFKIVRGDLLHHYPYGKLFALQDLSQEVERFAKQEIVPCGVLSGKKITLPQDEAWALSERYIDEQVTESGSHRFAWVFPQNIQGEYIPQKAHFELSFELPKGSYATILLECIAQKEMRGQENEC